MKTVMLYKPNSEHERLALDYLRDFKMQTGQDLQTIDAYSPQGIEMCQLYGIMDFPAVLAVDDEGKMQNMWVGEPLPRIQEVSYYTNNMP